MNEEDIVGKMVVATLSGLFKEVIAASKSLGKDISATAHDWLGVSVEKYARSAHERFGTMKILSMARPVPLDKIYTRVNVLDQVVSRQHVTIDDLEELRTLQRRFGPATATRPGLEAINEFQRIILLGKPGSGKTTFLKHVAIQSLANKLTELRIPVLVPLKGVSDSKQTLFEAITTEFELASVPHPTAFVESMLTKGRCRLLFDALDEVSDTRRPAIVSELNALARKYPRNQIVVSCRVAAFNVAFDNFNDIELADFGETEVRAFVRNWFRESPDQSEMCLQKLASTQGLDELCSTPLLLTMLCIAFEHNLDISSNRAELYRDAIDALLVRWDATRLIRRGDVYYDLTTQRKRDLFCEIAATAFNDEKYFFRTEELEAQIASFLQRITSNLAIDTREAASATLEAIEAHHGLVVERARGIHSFSHLTFQEYFTAKYIANAGRPSILAAADQLFDVRWREVLILTASSLSNADEFLVAILQKMSAFGFSTKPLARLEKPGLGQSREARKSGSIRRSESQVRDEPSASTLAEKMARAVEYVGHNRSRQISPKRALLGLASEVMIHSLVESDYYSARSLPISALESWAARPEDFKIRIEQVEVSLAAHASPLDATRRAMDHVSNVLHVVNKDRWHIEPKSQDVTSLLNSLRTIVGAGSLDRSRAPSDDWSKLILERPFCALSETASEELACSSLAADCAQILMAAIYCNGPEPRSILEPADQDHVRTRTATRFVSIGEVDKAKFFDRLKQRTERAGKRLLAALKPLHGHALAADIVVEILRSQVVLSAGVRDVALDMVLSLDTKHFD